MLLNTLTRRGLSVRSTYALPSLQKARYGWSLNSMRSSLSTQREVRPFRASGIDVVVPFLDYEDVILVSKIQTFIDRRMQLEQDLKKWNLGPVLGMAIETKKQDVVRFLLNKGADPNGWSCARPISHLAHAAHIGDLKTIRLLLGHGASPHGSGALWEAASAGDVRTAETLIDHGADVNEILSPKIYDNLDDDKDQFRLCQLRKFLEHTEQGTALHAAAGQDNGDMIEFLLSMGANQAIKNEEGETAADILRHNWCPPDPFDGCLSEERREQILDMLK